MPEGDTIHRAAETLARALVGKTVTRFDTGYAHLARVDDDRPIAGRTIESVRAVGKHLLMTFSGDLVLRTHMRMNGSWHIYRPRERWQRARDHARVVIETADFVAVGFDVPVASWHTTEGLARDPQLAALGPDPLDPAFDAAAARDRLRARADVPLEEAVLDQRVMAGLGNAFKSEVLFLAGLHPFAPVSSASDGELRRLVELAVKLMRANVRPDARGVVTYAGMRRTTGRADPSARLWVYGRIAEPCRRCGTAIVMERQGVYARSTYYCPRCQPPR